MLIKIMTLCMCQSVFLSVCMCHLDGSGIHVPPTLANVRTLSEHQAVLIFVTQVRFQK